MGNVIRAALVVGAIVIGCQPAPPAPVIPFDASDGAVDPCEQPGPADDCYAAAMKLCHLRCIENGRPLWVSPNGTPYAAICRRAKADGRDVNSNGKSRAACMANIATCAQVEGSCR